jgi:outer membrane lipoprotein-sorting protein
MKQISVLTLVAIMAINLCTTGYAQLNDAQKILTKVDEVSCAPEDQYMKSTMILMDKSGNQNERKDLMYLYLPAFRKVRMIASHVKNQNFAGTDFSYDDMSSFSFAKDYDSQLIESSDTFYSLKLTPKPELEKDYSQLKMWINKDSFVPSKIEYYDKNGNLWKTLTFDKIEKTGKYQIAKQMEMKDLKKSHSTKMIVNEIKLDSGLSDDIFTKRNLKRTR